MKNGYYLLFGVDQNTVDKIQRATEAMQKSVEDLQQRNRAKLEKEKQLTPGQK